MALSIITHLNTRVRKLIYLKNRVPINNYIQTQVTGGDCYYLFSIKSENHLNNTLELKLPLCNELYISNHKHSGNIHIKKQQAYAQCVKNKENKEGIDQILSNKLLVLDRFKKANKHRATGNTDIYCSIRNTIPIFKNSNAPVKKRLIYSDLKDDPLKEIKNRTDINLADVDVECLFFTPEQNANQAKEINELMNDLKRKIHCKTITVKTTIDCLY